jgi:hypothetical protein
MLGVTHVEAQVTIGGDKPPAKGVILDLNSDTKGGLLLTNVKLDEDDLTKIPEDFPGMSDIYNLTDGEEKDLALTGAKNNFKGAVVYNTNSDAGNGEGIYVWSGEKWNYYLSGRNIDNIPIRTIIPMPLTIPPDVNLAIGELDDLQISYRLSGSSEGALFPTFKNNGSTPITMTYYVFRISRNTVPILFTETGTETIGKGANTNIYSLGNHIGLYYKWWIYIHETHRELEFETFQLAENKMMLRYISKKHPDIP